MTASPRLCRPWLCLALAVLALLVPAAVSHAAAETGAFEFQNTFSGAEDDSATCLGPGATGTITGTERVVGRFTENGPPAFGFHDHGTSSQDYRVQYVDGRYAVGTAHIQFDDNATHQGELESTGVDVHDPATLYGADGQPLGPVTYHAVFHITFRDANGNHEPDSGEITANVTDVRLTCG